MTYALFENLKRGERFEDNNGTTGVKDGENIYLDERGRPHVVPYPSDLLCRVHVPQVQQTDDSRRLRVLASECERRINLFDPGSVGFNLMLDSAMRLRYVANEIEDRLDRQLNTK